MADNAQKLPFVRSTNLFAQRKALDAIQLLGKALPASVTAVSGSIVTVKFEVQSRFTLPKVTIPALMWQYLRIPIQVGDTGVVVPADADLGGIDGLGHGTADLTMPGNLSALVFVPVASKAWTAPDDPNAVVIYGPDGVILRDTNSKTKVTLTAGGIVVTLQAGDRVAITGDLAVTGSIFLGGTIQALAGGTYGGAIQTSGNVIAGVGGADQVGLQTHTHPQSGGGTTSPPTPGS